MRVNDEGEAVSMMARRVEPAAATADHASVDPGAVSHRLLVLVKHALPILEPAVPPRDWLLGSEGECQSRRLAIQLAPYAPFRLVASREPKALMTGRLLAAELDLEVSAAAGLEEFDRPALPLISREDHERLNEAIFRKPDTPVLGTESAADALNRFSRAIRTELARTTTRNLVAISHGTVISLFVAAHNQRDAFDIWKSLACPSFVVLEVPSFCLRTVVSPAD
ncbi:MAG TPA: histidine phosphatase family protein [Vicinamibacterales bacterium]|nr:histidine phosphatase family protein [Vicinamibacterales bacterium]